MSCYFPQVGGLEKQIKELAEFLVTRGIEVTVLTKKRTADASAFENISGVTVIRVKGNVKGLFVKTLQLQSKFDTVLLAGQLSNVSRFKFISTLAFGALLKAFLGKEVIFLPSSSGAFYEGLTGSSKKLALKLISMLSKTICISKEQVAFFEQKPMIVLDTPWGPPREGGIQTASLNLSMALKQAGLNPVILTRSHEQSLPGIGQVQGINIVRVSVNGIKHFVQKVGFLLSNLSDIDSYVIFGSYEKDLGLTLAVAATIVNLSQKKLIVRLSSELGHANIC